MALAIAALSGAGFADLEGVLVAGTVRLAPVMAYVIFGALLSRVTMSTGIAETIIAYAAEFGGDRPIVVALVLSAAVAALFTSLYGLGAIIMVGSIVLADHADDRRSAAHRRDAFHARLRARFHLQRFAVGLLHEDVRRAPRANADVRARAGGDRSRSR